MKIKLRAPELADLEVMFRIENAVENRLSANATGLYSRFQLERYIRESANDIYIDGSIRWVIECGEQVIGLIDIFAFDARAARAELGVYILPEWRGKGLALQAMQWVENYCFEHLGLHQLYAYVLVSNERSVHLFERAGYTRSGMLNDWVRIGKSYYDVCLYQKIALN